MGRVEMIILVGAIAILGRYSLTVNSVLLSSELNVLQSGYELNAILICDNLFNQAWLLAYDQNTVLSQAKSIPASFTSANSLGSETGEVYSDFNDIDDYNNYTATNTTVDGMTYTVSVGVGYVEINDKDTIVPIQTTLKKMTVTVVSNYLRNDISFSRLYPYWK
ncbi:MAG: hypothetical protein HQ562_09575 [Candidatus Marinimicrobia bacterium]|nr:hypothetical protein [Candidatus Neomarinimicrobiota bacterium]